MKKFIPNNISEEDAKIILTNIPTLNNNYKFNNLNLKDFSQATGPLVKVFTAIIGFINEHSSEKYLIKNNKDGIFMSGPTIAEGEAYFRVEQGTPSKYMHKWHVDTGDTKQMMWCKYGTSTLLSHPSSFKGAELEYCLCDIPCRQQMSTGRCDNNEVVSKETHYLGTGIHDSSTLHRLRCGRDSTDKVREGDRCTLLLFV